MMSHNLAIVCFTVQSGCDPKEEVEIELNPINFNFIPEYFSELLEAAEEYPYQKNLAVETTYEVIYRQFHDFDAAGALIDRYWEIIHEQQCRW
jgi:hypothetical protein